MTAALAPPLSDRSGSPREVLEADRQARVHDAGELLRLIDRLGGINPSRVRLTPPPGTATEAECVAANEDELREGLVELVDGTLVEKAMGAYESAFPMLLAELVGPYRRKQGGLLLGADTMVRVFAGQIRQPDACYFTPDVLPNLEALLEEPATPRVPALCVEVLSRGNTVAEVDRKIREYFAHGTGVVWIIDPRRRVARVYADPQRPQAFIQITEDGVLRGDPSLPGLAVELRELLNAGPNP